MSGQFRSRSSSALLEIGGAALRLGLTSFGGPIAHLAYFRHEYVEKRRWVDEATYADLVALCQFLPGPASSQLGIAIGTLRAGALGGFVAWFAFTLPSAVALVLFAQFTNSPEFGAAGWISGLKLAAVAVVAHAVLTMWRALAPDLRRSAVVLVAAALALALPSPVTQVLLIAVAGAVGLAILGVQPTERPILTASPIGRRIGTALLVIFAVLLVGLPVLRTLAPNQTVAVVEGFYRAGALVFGGGHVVLPLLHESLVPSGLIDNDTFLAGYGATQAVPGPLFTFAAYLGAVIAVPPFQPVGAAIALGAIFLPSFLLIWGVLPFWQTLRGNKGFRRAMVGANAAVVGILLAALYDPIAVTAVVSVPHAVMAATLFAGLAARRLPPWSVVLLAMAAGEGLSRL